MLTEKQRDYLLEYMRLLAERMNLGEWIISLLDEHSEVGAFASIVALKGRKVAQVRVAHDFETLSQDVQCHTIVHELMHLHFANAAHVIELDLTEHPHLTNGEADYIYSGFLRQLEYGIDESARIIAEYMPNPNKGLEHDGALIRKAISDNEKEIRKLKKKLKSGDVASKTLRTRP